MFGIDGNVVKRRILEQKFEIVGPIRIAIIRHPCVANGKFVKTKHIQDSHLPNHCTIQVRTLLCACCHQKPAVRSALNCQLLTLSVTVWLRQVLGSSLKVIENVLLLNMNLITKVQLNLTLSKIPDLCHFSPNSPPPLMFVITWTLPVP